MGVWGPGVKVDSFFVKAGKIMGQNGTAKVLKCAISLYNMAVEARCNGYESKLFDLAHDAAIRGTFIDESRHEKLSVWRTREAVAKNQVEQFNDGVWAAHIASIDDHIKDYVKHFKLKLALVNHI